MQEEVREALVRAETQTAKVAASEKELAAKEEAFAAVRDEVERDGTRPGQAAEDAGAAPESSGPGDRARDIDPSIAAGVRDALERNEQLRVVAGGLAPEVEQALEVLRSNGLWPGGGATKAAVGGAAPGEAADVPMVAESETIIKRLESDDEYKKQFEALCANGDAGADVKKLFTAVSERAAKRARAAPYGDEAEKTAKPPGS